MSDPYTLKTNPVCLTTPEYDWECRGYKVNEGPSILIRNGKIFLTYSASATDSTYCMGLLSVDENADLLNKDSWCKETQPVLTTDVNKGIFGPGHNSFTTSRDGKQDYLIYHARPYAEVDLNFALYDPNRHTWVKRIKNDDKGYPIFK